MFTKTNRVTQSSIKHHQARRTGDKVKTDRQILKPGNMNRSNGTNKKLSPQIQAGDQKHTVYTVQKKNSGTFTGFVSRIAQQMNCQRNRGNQQVLC